MDDNRIQVRIPADGDLEKWLTDRAKRMRSSPHVQARTEMELCRYFLELELQDLRIPLAWINCIADVLNGAALDAFVGYPTGIVFGEVSDAFQSAKRLSSYGAKWHVDEEDVLDWLVELRPTADHALRDAVSRWWVADLPPTDEGWAAVGINVIPVKHLRAFAADPDGSLRRAYELATTQSPLRASR
jgi:hypothetical protein